MSVPMQLASYARDAAGRLHFPGTSMLRTFHRPVPPQDLTEGQGSFVDKDKDAGSSVEPIVQALRSVDIRIGEEIHFVSFRYTQNFTHPPTHKHTHTHTHTHRNNLNKIMETPYNARDPWRIDLRRSRGTVYLDVVKLPGTHSQKFSLQ